MAGRIPQSFINDLLERIDIVDLIDARVKLTKAGKSYKACCPFHQEKTPSFNVNPDRGFYKCFGCGVSGTAITFLMEHDRMEFVEAVEALAALVHVEVPREGGGRIEKPDSGLYELLAGAAKLYRLALREHPEAIDYLKERGLDGETAQRFGIGYAPPGWDYLKTRLDADMDRMVAAGLVARNDAGRTYDRFRSRIMFPIRDSRGRVVAFGGRLMTDEDEGPKYLNSPETAVFHKARELYGLYEARHATHRNHGRALDRLIVVEGYMDVVVLARNGIPNAVATLGTAVGIEHFEKLYRNTSEVVCCFDGDRAGRQAAWRALEASLPSLHGGRQCKFVLLPEGEDPDSLVRSEGRENLQERIAGSKAAGDYLVEELSKGIDLGSMDARARLWELAKPHVYRIPKGVLRDLLVDRLARITGVEPDTLDPPPAQMAEPWMEEPPPDPGPPPVARTSGLDQRLLRCLLQRPSLFGKLDQSLIDDLFDGTDDDSLFLRVARWVKDGDADAPVLLARFVHEPVYDELRDLADSEQVLDAGALETEFVGGVGRYLEERARRRLRSMVDSIRTAPTKENIARYLSASRAARGQADDTDVKASSETERAPAK